MEYGKHSFLCTFLEFLENSPPRQPGPTNLGDYQGKWKVMDYQEKQKSGANTGEAKAQKTSQLLVSPFCQLSLQTLMSTTSLLFPKYSYEKLFSSTHTQ